VCVCVCVWDMLYNMSMLCLEAVSSVLLIWTKLKDFLVWIVKFHWIEDIQEEVTERIHRDGKFYRTVIYVIWNWEISEEVVKFYIYNQHPVLKHPQVMFFP
jgi:hypothetical protein